MVQLGKTIQCGLGTAVAVLVFCASTVTAARITSPNYQIDGNLGGTFGGETNSTSYRMTAIGGEAVVGSGASGSYILDQQQTNPSAETMQLGVQPSGLVGFYPMEENTGTTTADASQYQNDGTLSTNVAATWNAGGKIGSAITMNGASSGSYKGNGGVHVPDHPNLPSGSAMTVEAWLKQDANPTTNHDRAIASQWYMAMEDGLENRSSWSFATEANGGLSASIASTPTDNGGTYVFTGSNVFAYSVWNHVVMVYDGSLLPDDRIKFYVNGSLVSSTVSGNPVAPSLQDSSADLVIGAWPNIYQVMNGSIDHVKLFNRALSAAEITAEYTAQNAGASSGFGLEPTSAASTSAAVDAIVRTNSPSYAISLQQDHDLQSGLNTIPAVGGNIASPATWTEGTTRGFGFTLTGAPLPDAKWSNGSKYAAVPNAATVFYNGTGNPDKVPEVIAVQLRLHPSSGQAPGTYGNIVTYTGTMTP